MLHRFRDRFGTAGIVIAVIALIAALGGTALAAGGALTGKQKKEVEKIAKKYAGKPGAPGVAGTNGTNGKDGAEGRQGPEGKAGTNGTEGKAGTNGTNGAPGKSPEELATLAPGEEGCAAGGVLYGIPGGEESSICNGVKGVKGDTGEPWAAGGTLPPGAKETGTWFFTGTNADTGGIRIALSFPIPLASPLDEEHVHYFSDVDFGTFCEQQGGDPKPKPGNLCVYLTESVSGTVFTGIFKNIEEEEKGSLRTGAVLRFAAPTGAAVGGGSFAVTAPLAGP
jgi:hypothetical protein